MMKKVKKKITLNKNNKRRKNRTVEIQLKKVYGIRNYSSKISAMLGFSKTYKFDKLTSKQRLSIEELKKKRLVCSEKAFKKNKKDFFFTLLEMKHNKGNRLFEGLPIRGQRTRSNAKNAKKISKIWIKKRK